MTERAIFAFTDWAIGGPTWREALARGVVSPDELTRAVMVCYEARLRERVVPASWEVFEATYETVQQEGGAHDATS